LPPPPPPLALVCLSLLGTWSGEPWDPAHSNLSQLFISILAFIFTTEPLRNEPGLEASSPATVALYNAYLRLETLRTAMIGTLARPPALPPSEFEGVVKQHFREAWAGAIRPDLMQWGEREVLGEGGREGGKEGGKECWAAISGQITRMGWFQQAVGKKRYKAMMKALVESMDALVAGLEGEGGEGGGGGGATEAVCRQGPLGCGTEAQGRWRPRRRGGKGEASGGAGTGWKADGDRRQEGEGKKESRSGEGERSAGEEGMGADGWGCGRSEAAFSHGRDRERVRREPWA
ncbi:ubiquitin conjugating enzyme family protein, partial [Nannochloropsis gaditana]